MPQLTQAQYIALLRSQGLWSPGGGAVPPIASATPTPPMLQAKYIPDYIDPSFEPTPIPNNVGFAPTPTPAPSPSPTPIPNPITPIGALPTETPTAATFSPPPSGISPVDLGTAYIPGITQQPADYVSTAPFVDPSGVVPPGQITGGPIVETPTTPFYGPGATVTPTPASPADTVNYGPGATITPVDAVDYGSGATVTPVSQTPQNFADPNFFTNAGTSALLDETFGGGTGTNTQGESDAYQIAAAKRAASGFAPSIAGFNKAVGASPGGLSGSYSYGAPGYNYFDPNAQAGMIAEAATPQSQAAMSAYLDALGLAGVGSRSYLGNDPFNASMFGPPMAGKGK
jgi:hypothetical protein